MKQDLTRRALLGGAGATVLGIAVGAAAKASGSASGVADPGHPNVSWALLIDAERCASRDGCRVCIDACHEGHSVPSLSDPRHQVKWLWKAAFADVFPEQIHPAVPVQQRSLPVLVTCNHCGSPPCTRVCPTRATWKRPDGVVAMDPHRCIGCRYCMAACPYGARSFNWENPPLRAHRGAYPRRSAGVVEKCTLCVERLDEGLAPLCVDACQRYGSKALVFGNLDDPASAASRILASRRALRRRPELGTLPNVYYFF